MREDTMGFMRAVILADKCVDCGLCERVCAFNSDRLSATRVPIVYAARHKDYEEVLKSRSGAVFAGLSKWVLRRGGTVYGAAFEENWHVSHKRITEEIDLDALRGSKYVQSSIFNCFSSIASDLGSGADVLFSGTPCQTAAVKEYLNNRRVDCKKLLLVDIVCHGVPSPLMWEKYLQYVEKKARSKVSSICFRDKSKYGWCSHAEKIGFENGKEKFYSIWANLYNKGFLTRPDCSSCPYANLQRPSDITLGDFWGWERTDRAINQDDKGVSLVLIHTDKGKTVFEDIRKYYQVVPSDISRCIQPNLESPTAANPLAGRFMSEFKKYGFKYVMKKYSESGLLSRVKRFIYRAV